MLRILHTSDWHLGQTFHEFDRFAEHERFLRWLLDTLDAEQPDALVVAGDVFDHANPSATSQRQLYRFLTDARRRHPHLAIVLIAGNHDSPGRLEAPSPLLQAFDITVVGQVGRCEDGQVDVDRLVIPLRARGGEVAAWLLAIPFVRSSDLPATLAEPAALPSGDAQDQVPLGPQSSLLSPDPPAKPTASPYAVSVSRLYHRAVSLALSRCTGREAVVALGHCHVAGGEVTADSERPIVAAALDALGPDTFDPRITYVALGHFHRAQVVGGDERVRYAGSPLPLSFSETDYPHQVVCVDLEGGRLAGIRPIPVPRFVPLLRVPALPAPPQEVLDALAALDLPDVEEALRPYVEVRVSLDGPEPGLRAQIEEALSGKPVRLARIELSRALGASAAGAPAGMGECSPFDDLGRLQPIDVFAALYRGRFGSDPPPDLLEAFGELLRESAEGGSQ